MDVPKELIRAKLREYERTPTPNSAHMSFLIRNMTFTTLYVVAKSHTAVLPLFKHGKYLTNTDFKICTAQDQIAWFRYDEKKWFYIDTYEIHTVSRNGMPAGIEISYKAPIDVPVDIWLDHGI